MSMPPPPPSAPAPLSAPIDWANLVNAAQVVVPAPSGKEPPVDLPPSGAATDDVQKQNVADMRANRKLRKKYADKAYNLACGCISIWVVMLGSQGVIKALTGIEMWSEKVQIAVTTGVTVSILAAFLGVIRGLFPNSEKQKG